MSATAAADPARGSGFPGLATQALWFAMVTGLLEASYVLLRPRTYDLGAQVLWMAPLADLCWFLALAGVLIAARRLRPEWFGPQLQLAAFIGLAGVSVLLLAKTLSGIAALFLGVGLGVQASRILASRLTEVGALVRRTALPLAGAVLLAALGLTLLPRTLERRAVSRLPAARAGAPNVLLLVLDTVRELNLSLSGYGRPTTPGLTRWAARGVRFDRAIATSSWTLPSHGSMFTGRLPDELSASWLDPLDARYPTLAETLQEAGYTTAGFVANPTYGPREYGLSRGFLHYDDYALTPAEVLVSTSIGRALSKSRRLRLLARRFDIPGRKSAHDVNTALLGWLRRQPAERPFFGFINYFDAHQPYLPPAAFDGRFASPTPRRLQLIYRQGHFIHEAAMPKGNLAPAELRRELDAYEAAIAYIDSEVSGLLDTLEARGLLEHTVVVVTADHGEQFGEHGLFDHGNSLYTQLIEVPLVILAQGGRTGHVVPEPVSLRDLPATLLDLSGAGPRLPGHSLRPYIMPEAAAPRPTRPVVSELRTSRGTVWASAILDSLHYLRIAGAPEELYHLARDPQETVNLAGCPEFAPALASLRATVDSLPPAWSGAADSARPYGAIDSIHPHGSNQSPS